MLRETLVFWIQAENEQDCTQNDTPLTRSKYREVQQNGRWFFFSLTVCIIFAINSYTQENQIENWKSIKHI